MNWCQVSVHTSVYAYYSLLFQFLRGLFEEFFFASESNQSEYSTSNEKVMKQKFGSQTENLKRHDENDALYNIYILGKNWGKSWKKALIMYQWIPICIFLIPCTVASDMWIVLYSRWCTNLDSKFWNSNQPPGFSSLFSLFFPVFYSKMSEYLTTSLTVIVTGLVLLTLIITVISMIKYMCQANNPSNFRK